MMDARTVGIETAWRALDEELLTGLAALPERSDAELERVMIWPEAALFYREPMPPRAGRSVGNMQAKRAR